MSTNALAEKKVDPAYSLAQSLEKSVGMALPAHITKEQFSRAFLTALRKMPDLVLCTKESISTAVVTAAQLGLMIGINGACWLIPFKNKGVHECELIIGYQGLVDLSYRSSLVDSIFSDVVCKNDEFTYRQGLDQCLNHIPCLHGERGDPFAVYAIARIKESKTPVYVVLNKCEIEKVKKSSKAYQSDLKYNTKRSPWSGEFETEMWKKTAIRRLCKLLPKSVELVRALDFEAKQEERWAEATIEDDPFAQGRNSLPSRNAAKADSEPATASNDQGDISPPPEDIKHAYAKLNANYNEHGEEIDNQLRKNGAKHDLPDLQEATDPVEIAAIIKTAAQMKE